MNRGTKIEVDRKIEILRKIEKKEIHINEKRGRNQRERGKI